MFFVLCKTIHIDNLKKKKKKNSKIIKLRLWDVMKVISYMIYQCAMVLTGICSVALQQKGWLEAMHSEAVLIPYLGITKLISFSRSEDKRRMDCYTTICSIILGGLLALRKQNMSLVLTPTLSI